VSGCQNLSEASSNRRTLLIDPIERITEILFGIIMVLTVTCSFSVARASHEGVREMVAAALGCNLAWGLVDAVFYLMTRFGEQGRRILAMEALRKTQDPDKARRIIAKNLPPLFASVVTPGEYEELHQRLNRISEVPTRPRLVREDWLGAVGVFLLVFVSTFPVVIPFLILSDARVSLRTSNGVAILMLFFAGYTLGGYIGRRRLVSGVVLVIGGMALVGACIALGG
jgi:hypothetical protein